MLFFLGDKFNSTTPPHWKLIISSDSLLINRGGKEKRDFTEETSGKCYLTQVSKVNITSDFMWVTCILCHDMIKMRLHHCVFLPKTHHLNLIIVIIINHTVLNWRHSTTKYLTSLPQNYLKSWKSRQDWYTVTANNKGDMTTKYNVTPCLNPGIERGH